jgi:autotransporter-associated beta strand protein
VKTIKLARYLALNLGLVALLAVPTRARAATVTLTTGDAVGSSSFNSAGNWSNGQAPSGANDYVVTVQYLRTPADGNNYAFAGNSLTLTNGGAMIYKGTASANTYTITSFALSNGGLVRSGAGSGNTMVLAGNLTINGTNATSEIRADQSPYTINSSLMGTGNLLISGSGFSVTLNGTNSYTGNMTVSGSLTVGTSGNLNFVIGASNVNNQVTGTGAAAFNGQFVFNLSNASTNLGDGWTIANVSGQTFGTTFSVAGFTRQGFGTGPGTWDLNVGNIYYEFVTAFGTLTVVSQPSAPVSTVGLGAAGGTFGAIEADLLAAYAPSYASSVGGEDNAQVIIANTVAGSNQIQDQGGTGAHMRIAGFYQSSNDVAGLTTTGGIVTWLADDDAHLADVVSYGATVGADLVVYICNNTDSSSISGVSQQPGMYSSLNPGAVWSAVFAHETGGHCYGRAHSDGIVSPKTIMLHNYCGGGAAPPYYYTNPQIWFNGVQLIGNTASNCSMGALINNGDNSFPIGTTTQNVADRRARVVVGPNLNNVVLHWSFTNAPAMAPAGTTISDQISGAPAIVRGTNALFTGTALRIPGGSTGNVPMNSMAAYVDLPNGIISSQTNITIEIWATPLSAPNDARICDFGRTAQAGDGLGAPGEYTGTPGTGAPGSTQPSDDILLSAATGTVITVQQFGAEHNGTNATLDSGLPTTAGVPHCYAITFTDGAGAYGSSGGRWQWYRDGDPVTYLDVNFHLAALQDVNNWLGRSQYSSDAIANNDYAEVRISNVALSRGQVLANFMLGPNYVPTATATLTNNDASGGTSFNAAGQWSNGGAPSSGNSYETLNFQLRTPATGGSYTFAGDSLKISGGSLLYEGTSSSTITITNLILNAGAVRNDSSATCTLAGNVTVTTNGAEFNCVNGAELISANISGNGPITYLGNAATLSGNNSGFTGKTLVGNGAAGMIVIDSESRLGPIPPNLTLDQLTMNRGTLVTTATMTLSNSNRGILINISGGTFSVSSGTLTLASTLSSPITPSGVVAGGITKTGPGTLVLGSPTTLFKGTLFVDSSSNAGNDGVVKLVNNQVLANAHSPIFIRDNNNGTSTFQLDGTAGNLTLSQGITVSCRNNPSPAIESVAGTNTINGFITLSSGGSLFTIQSDAGLLVFSGTNQYLGSLVGARTYSFQGAGNHLVSGPILNSTNGSAIALAKSGPGTLTLAGNNTYAAGTSVNGGTLLVNGSIVSNVTVASSATLGGNGTINGPVTVQSGGTLSTGASIAALTVNNTLALQGTVFLKVNQATGGNDLVRGITSLTYGGTLAVSNLAGTFVGGESYQLFNSGAFTSSFATMNLPALNAGLGWKFNPTTGTLTVLSAPPIGLTAMAGNAQVALNWGASAGATSYNVKRATVSGGPYTIIANPTTTSYTDTSVASGTTYYYVVSTINTGGEGLNSGEVSAYVLTAFQQWQMQYFQCTNCLSSAPNADPLGKGISNTNQFLLGLNPTNPASVFRILSVVPQGNDIVVTWQAAGIRTNAVQSSSGDGSGDYSNNFSDIIGSQTIFPSVGDAVTNFTDLGGATNAASRFYRIRLVQ